MTTNERGEERRRDADGSTGREATSRAERDERAAGWCIKAMLTDVIRQCLCVVLLCCSLRLEAPCPLHASPSFACQSRSAAPTPPAEDERTRRGAGHSGPHADSDRHTVTATLCSHSMTHAPCVCCLRSAHSCDGATLACCWRWPLAGAAFSPRCAGSRRKTTNKHTHQQTAKTRKTHSTHQDESNEVCDGWF